MESLKLRTREEIIEIIKDSGIRGICKRCLKKCPSYVLIAFQHSGCIEIELPEWSEQ